MDLFLLFVCTVQINRVAKAKTGDKAGKDIFYVTFTMPSLYLGRTRNDFVQTAVSDNQIELRSANMVAAAEDLQQLMNELKQSVILSDFSQLNKVQLAPNEIQLINTHEKSLGCFRS
jgi:hypothetical protein